MNFWCQFRHHNSIRRPRLINRVQNFRDLATFSIDFCVFYMLNVRHICNSGIFFWFVWPTDLESISHASTLTSIIATKIEVDMTIHCRVIAFLSADTSRELVTLTFYFFDLKQLYMVGHVSNLATKYKDPTPNLSWVVSYNVSGWLPLKMCTRPLLMLRITWPVSKESKTITFLEFSTTICLLAMQLRWLNDKSN